MQIQCGSFHGCQVVGIDHANFLNLSAKVNDAMLRRKNRVFETSSKSINGSILEGVRTQINDRVIRGAQSMINPEGLKFLLVTSVDYV